MQVVKEIAKLTAVSSLAIEVDPCIPAYIRGMIFTLSVCHGRSIGEYEATIDTWVRQMGDSGGHNSNERAEWVEELKVRLFNYTTVPTRMRVS